MTPLTPRLSVVIPAHNEEGCIEATVRALHEALSHEGIPHEIVVVEDHSTDRTPAILARLAGEVGSLRPIANRRRPGFGLAIQEGLDYSRGEAVAIYMADASDTPQDLIAFLRKLEAENLDCVFGSRFLPGSRLVDYPKVKWLVNRLGNKLIQLLFSLGYNDVSNAFKLYRRSVIDGVKPILSHHFNLTVELPLKAIIRGYRYAVVPNTWINRKTGKSKLKIREMSPRYLFIILYCFLEKWLSRGDYAKPEKPVEKKPPRAA